MQRLLDEDQQEVEVTTPATTRKSVHSEELKVEIFLAKLFTTEKRKHLVPILFREFFVGNAEKVESQEKPFRFDRLLRRRLGLA